MAHAQTQPGFDPRKIITAESFHVAPHLLGLPLASPGRRLAAILVDLLFCSLLANSGKVTLALALAVSFFWVAGRKLGKGGGFFSRSAKAAFRGVGALMLFIAAIAIWNSARGRVRHAAVGDAGEDAAPGAAMSVNGSPGQQSVSVETMARSGLAVVALTRATDSAGAAAAARAAIPRLRGMQMNDASIRETLLNVAQDRPAPVRAGVLAALAAADSAKAASENGAPDSAAAALAARPDSLAALYVAAVHAGDSARAGELRPKLASVLARDSLQALRAQVGELQEKNAGLERDERGLRREKEKAEKRGLLSLLLQWLDDLGIGFGWTGLYFTAFGAVWKGQTPGKKLLGIRVLRLDGLPMTLWASFERFGGYAAGFFTGLLGFAQVFWDRNRQAIQDKISETVVIRDVRVPLPVAPPQPYPRPQPPRWPPAGVGTPQ